MANEDILGLMNDEDEYGVSPGLSSYFSGQMPDNRESAIQLLQKDLEVKNAAYQDALTRAYKTPTLSKESAIGTTFATVLPLLLGAAFAGSRGRKAAAPAMVDAAKVGISGFAADAERNQKAGLAEAAAAQRDLQATQSQLSRQADNLYDDRLAEKRMQQQEDIALMRESRYADQFRQMIDSKNKEYPSEVVDAMIRYGDGKASEEDKRLIFQTPGALKDANETLAKLSYNKSVETTAEGNNKGKNLLSSNFDTSESIYIPEKEAVVLNDKLVAKKEAIRAVNNLKNIYQKEGLFLSILKSGSPEEKQKVGQYLQQAADARSILLQSFMLGNPLAKGNPSDSERKIFESRLPPDISTEKDPSKMFNLLFQDKNIALGRLQEIEKEMAFQYGSALQKYGLRPKQDSTPPQISTKVINGVTYEFGVDANGNKFSRKVQ